MSEDGVTIPRDLAKRAARAALAVSMIGDGADLNALADLGNVLRAATSRSTLREKLHEIGYVNDVAVDGILGVVAREIEALPSGGIHGSTPHYRAAVLALVRGES